MTAHNDVISGFIHCGKALDEDADEQTGEVYALDLLAESQGVGIGRKLRNAAIEELRVRGVRKCMA